MCLNGVGRDVDLLRKFGAGECPRSDGHQRRHVRFGEMEPVQFDVTDAIEDRAGDSLQKQPSTSPGSSPSGTRRRRVRPRPAIGRIGSPPRRCWPPSRAAIPVPSPGGRDAAAPTMSPAAARATTIQSRRTRRERLPVHESDGEDEQDHECQDVDRYQPESQVRHDVRVRGPTSIAPHRTGPARPGGDGSESFRGSVAVGVLPQGNSVL